MVTDPRSGMKTYLETYWTAANVTLDDAVTYAQWVVMYGRQVNDVHRILMDMAVDVLLTVEEPEPATALLNSDLTPYGYKQLLPVRAWCIDKFMPNMSQTVTGTILKGKVEIELRRILETYPTGSQYRLEQTRSVDQELGMDRVYGLECLVNYRRSVTA